LKTTKLYFAFKISTPSDAVVDYRLASPIRIISRLPKKCLRYVIKKDEVGVVSGSPELDKR
jgi:hypothetical protein